jgi:hypothetical protein
LGSRAGEQGAQAFTPALAKRQGDSDEKWSENAQDNEGHESLGGSERRLALGEQVGELEQPSAPEDA